MTGWILSEPLADDLPELLALLEDSGLPCSDLTVTHLPEFLICRDDGRLIAAAGLESRGDAVLLRSLAVAEKYRRHGLAGQLLDALEGRVLARKQRQIFLLTTTAPGFFADRGFLPFPRQFVPPEIAETTEFRSLCPASAICMHKTLGDEACR